MGILRLVVALAILLLVYMLITQVVIPTRKHLPWFPRFRTNKSLKRAQERLGSAHDSLEVAQTRRSALDLEKEVKRMEDSENG